MQQGRDHVRDVLKSRRLPRRSPTFSSSADSRRSLPCGLLAHAAPLGLAGRSPRRPLGNAGGVEADDHVVAVDLLLEGVALREGEEVARVADEP